MKSVDSCTITNTTKGKPPRLPFVYIKEAILGKKYDLSVGFISPRAQRALNHTYRGKDTTTNILSFSLSKNSGELTFDLKKVKKDAPLFDMSYREFLKFLFIHGLLHLKGYEHGSTMEKAEKKWLKLTTPVE